MTNEQIEHCEILIEELEKAQKQEREPVFSMERWVDPILDRARTMKALRARIKEVTLDPCGTAACLAGKAGLFPRIRKLGFKWDVVGKSAFCGARANFTYDGAEGSQATRLFFGYSTFAEVFMRTKIRTLNGALRVLKKHVKDEIAYNEAIAASQAVNAE